MPQFSEMSGKKLLVADDSLTIQKVIKLALSNEGYEIHAVSDGTDALQQISIFKPDVVLVDVSLPGKNAFELKREANARFGQDELRFILMSSAFEKVDDKQVHELGFHGQLTKPFDPAHLRLTLTEAIGKERRSYPSFTQAAIDPNGSEPPQQDDEIQKLTESTFSDHPNGSHWSIQEPPALDASQIPDETMFFVKPQDSILPPPPDETLFLQRPQGEDFHEKSDLPPLPPPFDIESATQMSSYIQQKPAEAPQDYNLKLTMPSEPLSLEDFPPTMSSGFPTMPPPFTFQSPPPLPTPAAPIQHEPSGPTPEELKALIEKLVQEQVQSTVQASMEHLSKHSLAAVAEKIIKEEIHKILMETETP